MSALFFIEEIKDNQFFITGEDARHIYRSLRMTVGEQITVCDKNCIQHDGIIINLSDDVTECKVLKSYPCEGEPNISVTLFQALVKGDKMELIIQKAVELGVSKIVPVLTKRCISRPDRDKSDKKRLRMQKIADAAAMQSRRGRKIEVTDTITLDDVVKQSKSLDICTVFYEKGGDTIKNIFNSSVKNKNIGIIVGSEGGFEEEEINYLCSHEIQPVTLGKRILRAETAPLTALSIIMFMTDNM